MPRGRAVGDLGPWAGPSGSKRLQGMGRPTTKAELLGAAGCEGMASATSSHYVWASKLIRPWVEKLGSC